MTKSIEVSGRTEDEAIQAALEQLGLSRDDVSVEIVERAKTGFLGLKNTPAIVKVLYEAKENRSEQVEVFLTGLFERMSIDVDLEISGEDGAINVSMAGKDPGSLIGRRGETLDAIQRITNYVVNRGSTDRVRVNLDAENYRQRRNETLEALAERVAAKVQKYRRNMTLDPMNAYERHVIHTALQNSDNISTYSIGNEPNRRIVVAYGRSKNDTGDFGNRYGASGIRSGNSGNRSGSSFNRSGTSSNRSGSSFNRSAGGSVNSGKRSDNYGNSDESDYSDNSGNSDNSSNSGNSGNSSNSGNRSGSPQYREWS